MARLPRSLVDARTLATPTRWRKLSMISAISARGEIAFRIVEGSINTDRFIEFLDALIEGAKRKIFLVVDNLRVHQAKRVSAWLADKTERIELLFLPPYAPESNPDEYLNRDFKTALRSSAVSRDTANSSPKPPPSCKASAPCQSALKLTSVIPVRPTQPSVFKGRIDKAGRTTSCIPPLKSAHTSIAGPSQRRSATSPRRVQYGPGRTLSGRQVLRTLLETALVSPLIDRRSRSPRPET
jgi:transposase